MWRPFDSRCLDILRSLEHHRRAFFEEIRLWHIIDSERERAGAAATRRIITKDEELSSFEEEEAEMEHTLADRELGLVALETHQSTQERDYVRPVLEEIRANLRHLERQRICKGLLPCVWIALTRVTERDFERSQQWISPPAFLDAREKARGVRQHGTATWIFDEFIYKQWLNEGLPAPGSKFIFGSNVMWIYGMPPRICFLSILLTRV
jgi:hypothetical protein